MVLPSMFSFPKIRPRWGVVLSLIPLLWSLGFAPLWADTSPAFSVTPYLEKVMNQVSTFRLSNGLQLIILENHEAPVVSFVTYANVGGVDEEAGKTGIAHFLEHLAFKGTSTIGTTDYAKEAPLLKDIDGVFAQLKQARQRGDEAAIAQLSQRLRDLDDQAKQYVKQNEFGQIVEAAGGVGLNAATASDFTRYFYSFPANKVELWMALESSRFLDPVFREFDKEREVILEERRMRTDNSPIGLLVEKFLQTAFAVHPYGRPVIGYPQDLENLERDDVKAFFQKHYGAKNLTLAIAGDVDPQEVRRLAQVYFGRLPAGKANQSRLPQEPPQTAVREVTVTYPSQPWYLEGYHRPALTDRDHPVYELIASLLSDGRTSRLYRALVEGERLALSMDGLNGFPGDRYPNMILFYGLTAPGHSVEALAAGLDRQIQRLIAEPVSEAELNRVKTQARAGLLRSLDSNMGMANLLAEYQAKTGDWRNGFRELEALEKVTAADVQRVARATFRPENRIVGKLLPGDRPS